MRNPYISRGPIRTLDLFFGRTHALQEMAAFLSGNQSMSIIGPRKIGKTSLFFQLMRPESWPSFGLGADHVFAYLDCEMLGERTPEEILGQFAREIEAALDVYGQPPEPALATAAAQPSHLAFDAALRRLNQRRLRVVLLLDEFERLSANPHLDASFFNALRSTAARYPLVILTASAQTLITLTYPLRSPQILSSPFFNIFAPLFLGLLPESEARQLIREPARQAGRAFSPALEDFVYTLAGGHPFILQVACFHAFENPEALAEIEGRTLEELEAHFEYYWRNLTTLEQDTLRQVSEAAAREAGDTTLRRVLRDLVQKCLLVAEAGAYRYPSRAWESFVSAQALGMPQPSVRPAEHLTGLRLGPYEVIASVGRGGMAEVYKGHHLRLGRTVAIKILPAHLAAEPDFRARFEREAQAVAALKHPNIVQVFDFGDSEGIYYMVMEYIAGQNLAQHLAEAGPLPLAQALPLLQHVASALDYAHAQGLVHRDVKPSNVMLEIKDEGGSMKDEMIGQTASSLIPHPSSFFRAVLTDFGIVRMLGGITGATKTAMMGTLNYMAPEQIRVSQDVDGRADVYALGVMTCQMLTGKLPFSGDNPGAVLMAHLQQPAPDPREFKPDLPERTAHAILRALAKEPEDRYRTAGELVADLA